MIDQTRHSEIKKSNSPEMIAKELQIIEFDENCDFEPHKRDARTQATEDSGEMTNSTGSNSSSGEKMIRSKGAENAQNNHFIEERVFGGKKRR